MLIKVSNDLKKMDVYANGNELATIMGKDRIKNKRIYSYPLTKKQFVATFNNPILMTDTAAIAKLPCELRDTLFSLYMSRPRIVEYDGTSVWWNDTKHISVWCPSIDTILFAKALNKIFQKNNSFKTALEIGTGSGFLSKYCLQKLKALEEMYILDISPYAIQCAQDNITDIRARFLTANALEFLKSSKKKFDLLICNPPYVPRPKSIDDNPYEGVSLLYELLHNAKNYLNPNGILVINISSLSMDIAFDKKPMLPVKLLEKLEVPLKVNNIHNNKAWLDYLIKKHNLKVVNKKGYKYWQTLYIFEVKNA
jgi:release factor glutamine methyltransferase